jgi:hypothetical protein
MNERVYNLDSSNIVYDKVDDEGRMTFDFVATMEEAKRLRHPRAIVQGSRTGFKVTRFTRRPGPPQNDTRGPDKVFPYRMTLEFLT